MQYARRGIIPPKQWEHNKYIKGKFNINGERNQYSV